MAYSVTQILNRVTDYANSVLQVVLKAGTAVIGKVGMQVGGADVADANPIPAKLTGSLVSANDTLKVRDCFTAKEAIRATLTPSSESTKTFTAAFEALHVLNYGPGDIYLDIDAAAAIGGADDVLVEEGTSITIPLAGTAVHVIGSSASVVQLLGYRTPASA